jgi:hypothetical protein
MKVTGKLNDDIAKEGNTMKVTEYMWSIAEITEMIYNAKKDK